MKVGTQVRYIGPDCWGLDKGSVGRVFENNDPDSLCVCFGPEHYDVGYFYLSPDDLEDLTPPLIQLADCAE